MHGAPTLLVTHPTGYESERAYALETVLGTLLGLRHVARPARRDDVAITVDGAADRCLRVADVLFATHERDWLTEAALPPRPLERLTVPGEEPLALLYAVSGPGPSLSGGEAWLGVDVFGGAFFMLTRYEELVRTGRDAHDRFPAEASIAFQERFLERPIVHEYAELLWDQLAALWPGLTRAARRFRLSPSHDVDWPAMPDRPAHAVVRNVVADVIRRRDTALAVDRVRWEVARRRGRLVDDPYDRFDELMDLSERAGVRSAFYFMAGATRPGVDGGYSLRDPRIEGVLRRIHDRGHEIGLHPSYDSFLRPEVIVAEFASLKAACSKLGIEQAQWGGRQHFLRWHNPTTWQAWEDAGLDYDSTLTFAGHAGFRTGACVEFPVFNLRSRRRLRLRERPLIAMDGALFGSFRATHREAEEIVVRLRDRCRRVGGDFRFLWHNSNLLSRRDLNLYTRILAT